MSEAPAIDQRDRHARLLLWATAAATVLYALLLLTLPADTPRRPLICDLGYLPFRPLAALLLWSASNAGTDETRRRGLRLLAAGQFIGTYNSVLWVLSSMGSLAVNAPAFQYAGMAMSALEVAGIALLVPRRGVAGSTAVVPFVDASLLAIASIAIGWQFVGAPLLRTGGETALDFLWFAVMTAADCFAAFIAVGAWAYPTPRVRTASAALLALAFGLSAWFDVIIELGTLNKTYVSGGAIDIAFAAGIALLGVVGYLEHGRPRHAPPDERRVVMVRLLLPFVAAAAVLVPVLVQSAQPATGALRLIPWTLLVVFVALMQWRFHLLERAAEGALTSRLALERDLRLSQQFESLGRYAASVAHDFNNLLAALLAQVQLTKFTGGVTAAGAERLGEMEKTIGSGTTLVRRLMQMSRGGSTPATRVDLVRVVRTLAVTVSRLLPPDVLLSLDVPAEPVVVTLRPGDADQVLLNLVVNARDALPKGGRITVGLRREGSRAVLSVSDNGDGIPPEVLGKIFQPFFTTKAAQGGTGLGLATVSSIASQSKGIVDVASELDVGTTFTISWDAATE
ncbi:MAG: sensor histidine kinase [Gemmatimonadaceae bacterium]